MKRKNTIFSKLYVVLCLAFFYLPILVTMIFSFNSSKSLTRFTGFSLRWYGELINNMEISKAVYVSVTVAILATVISTVLGTITAIGLSKSRKVLKEMVLTINNFPILNPEIVTAIGLMLLFSSLGMTKGYLTMLLAHIAFCTPYVITSVYPKVRSLDPNLANAAMDLGATPYQALTKVIVPMIKEGIFAGAHIDFTEDNMNFDRVKASDPELYAGLEKELARQRANIELIASENFVSPAVMEAMGSHLTNKYAEGYPGKRYYGGCQCVDVVESIAIERAKKLFGCDYANVQPHSGAQANMAVFIAMLKPGDTVMGMNLDHGGHLTHGSPVNFSGLYFNIVPYGVDDNGVIDYEEVERIALEAKPKLIIAGASAYAREIDFKRFREIADKVGAYLMVDMAHIAGLVAAGLHQSPIPYADVVTTTTHKTLRGPRGGLILANKEAAEKFNFNKAIFPGTQGGPLEHIIAGKAVCFGEALKPEFKEYQLQVKKNAAALAAALQKQGFKILTGGTDNHLMLVDLRGMDISGKELQNRCDEVYITLNKNTVPNDPRSPFVTSGVRIGTPAVTTRGLKEEDMEVIAECIWLAATDFENKADYIRAEVTKLCEKYPLYK